MKAHITNPESLDSLQQMMANENCRVYWNGSAAGQVEVTSLTREGFSYRLPGDCEVQAHLFGEWSRDSYEFEVFISSATITLNYQRAPLEESLVS